MHPLISVIVLNWNGKDMLAECLQSLEDQTYPNFEIIVVDNGSNDGSQYYVRTHFPDVNLIELPENLGFCGGNNAGFRRARGEYVALLNNDTRVSVHWLESLYKAIDRRHDAGMATSKIVFFDEPDLIDTAGDLFFTCGIGRKRGHMLPDGHGYDQERLVFGACAGAALYRREMLQQIDFLDEDFFIYYDDVDLSFRAQLAGWKCVYVPSAKVMHRVSATMSKAKHHTVYLAKRNTLWVIFKNMPTPLLLKYGLLIIGYHLATDFKWILLGYGRSVLKGRLDALRALGRILIKRSKIQSSRKISFTELEKIMSHGIPRSQI